MIYSLSTFCSQKLVLTGVLFSSVQNVYVNISRILTAASKLIEGGHYASAHVRYKEETHFFSVVDPNTLKLDLDSEVWPNLNPDPGPDPDTGLCYQF